METCKSPRKVLREAYELALPLLPGDAHPEAVEILRAMGYHVAIELTAMSARVVPEPGAGVLAVVAGLVLGRSRRRRIGRACGI